MVFKSQTDMPESCPPSNAAPNNVEPVYRFIENETVGEIDFLNHKERKKRYPSEKTCEALAISFFTTTRAAQRAGRNFKNLKGKIFAEGKITSECGIHNIENGHLNLWLFQGVDMLKVFLGEEDRGETN
ncbi:hypothetical protein [Neobacillus niacini]|uniref:hypothetical protein n=1 Tax=Neobacillus niacini TaxID=86668 RepID=UPI0005EFC629|nr:hypothetical protein [Neobacillus niacini]